MTTPAGTSAIALITHEPEPGPDEVRTLLTVSAKTALLTAAMPPADNPPLC